MLPSKTKKIDKTFLSLSKSKGRSNKQVIIAFPTLKKNQYQESYLILIKAYAKIYILFP
jgi:hypothetical protein